MNNELSKFLPEPLPADPLALLCEWFQYARTQAAQPNPDAMVLATVDAQGRPDARVVLCKQLIAPPGYAVFFTNYQSRKGQELNDRPYASAVMHWDSLSRQVRLEGRVVKSPVAESDAYFSSRPLASRLGAWASLQSQPLASRQQLSEQLHAAAQRFGIQDGATEGDVPRPSHWGGYRLWFEAVELWVEGPGRVHDRARWTRTLTPKDIYSFDASAWQETRLNP